MVFGFLVLENEKQPTLGTCQKLNLARILHGCCRSPSRVPKAGIKVLRF